MNRERAIDIYTAVLMSVLLYCFVAWAETRYTVTDLGHRVTPFAMNVWGNVVGNVPGAEPFSFIPSVWHNGEWIDLRDLGWLGGSVEGIDDRWIILGLASDPDGSRRAFTFDPVTGRTTRLTRPSWLSSVYSLAGRERDGTVWGTGVENGKLVPLKWRSPTSVSRLASLGVQAEILDVGRLRVPVGWSRETIDNLPTAVWWGLDGKIHPLAPTTEWTRAHAINSWGLVGGAELARAWDLWGGDYHLPVFPGHYARVIDLNDTPVGVGYNEPPSGEAKIAVLWSEETGYYPVSLVDLADAEGWTFQDAIAITNAGQILGTGTFNGQPHAWLLTPVSW